MVWCGVVWYDMIWYVCMYVYIYIHDHAMRTACNPCDREWQVQTLYGNYYQKACELNRLTTCETITKNI